MFAHFCAAFIFSFPKGGIQKRVFCFGVHFPTSRSFEAGASRSRWCTGSPSLFIHNNNELGISKVAFLVFGVVGRGLLWSGPIFLGPWVLWCWMPAFLKTSFSFYPVLCTIFEYNYAFPVLGCHVSVCYNCVGSNLCIFSGLGHFWLRNLRLAVGMRQMRMCVRSARCFDVPCC